ncbi:hypothetical protein CPB84DRAFT_1849803 [Gymnopilus junonius]|uniref:Uncharacterized protein n=1 Tax=Gymnopilus junonius TaxID=109634 RepID=A0A9P5NHX6_GYMJU|nr:hypothetical protein CPB84DRAFT_1849803 [Gymnopilus junonius]
MTLQTPSTSNPLSYLDQEFLFLNQCDLTPPGSPSLGGMSAAIPQTKISMTQSASQHPSHVYSYPMMYHPQMLPNTPGYSSQSTFPLTHIPPHMQQNSAHCYPGSILFPQNYQPLSHQNVLTPNCLVNNLPAAQSNLQTITPSSSCVGPPSTLQEGIENQDPNLAPVSSAAPSNTMQENNDYHYSHHYHDLPAAATDKVWKLTDGMTTCIRHHLSKQHTKVYETTIQVKGLKHANMSPHASQTSNSSIDLNAPFSVEKFLDLLQRWVVIDDQLIHILECPEFCDLMLYLGAGKIDDKDLPHCHKMMDMIIDAYKR